jgi:hypothetical protein
VRKFVHRNPVTLPGMKEADNRRKH